MDNLDISPATFTAYAVVYCGVITLFQGVLAFVFANSLRLNPAGIGALGVAVIGVFIAGFGVAQLCSVPAVDSQYGTYEYVVGGFASWRQCFC